jgi:cytochrome c
MTVPKGSGTLSKGIEKGSKGSILRKGERVLKHRQRVLGYYLRFRRGQSLHCAQC